MRRSALRCSADSSAGHRWPGCTISSNSWNPKSASRGSSTWRTDQLAYGGVKDSGIGREGPRYSIRDMTEQRMVLFNY